MDTGIMISRDGAQYGPYTLAQVTEYLAAGSLLPTDLAWNAAQSAWVPLSQLVAPKPAGAVPPPPPPPVPPRERNVFVLILMGMVWWFVFMIVPFFIICFFAGMVAGIMHPDNPHAAGADAGRIIGGILALPLLILSIVLSVWLTVIGKLPGTRKE